MTKADDRRLDKIEASLTPKQAFLLWLEEAHEHGSLARYVMLMRCQPIERHPYQRLPRQVEQAVRERSKKTGPDVSETIYPGRGLQKAAKERAIEGEVIHAIREVAFYIELHTALTGRVSAEWKAMALQTLLALNLNRELVGPDPTKGEWPMQRAIDQARHFVVQSAGDLLVEQSIARRLADQ
jgi:hypothetical protein